MNCVWNQNSFLRKVKFRQYELLIILIVCEIYSLFQF